MYEMLVGYPPFHADDPRTTCRKVMSRLFECKIYLNGCFLSCIMRVTVSFGGWQLILGDDLRYTTIEN